MLSDEEDEAVSVGLPSQDSDVHSEDLIESDIEEAVKAEDYSQLSQTKATEISLETVRFDILDDF